MPSCPTYTGSPAVALVNEGWSFFEGLSLQSFDIAKGLIVDMAKFTIDPVSFNYTFDPPSSPSGFIAPAAPADPNLVYNTGAFHEPGDTPAIGIPAVNFQDFPQQTFSPPGQFAHLPTASEPSPDFGAAPILTTITLPTLPALNNPNAPTLYTINLPSVPSITLPTFDGVAPVVDFVAPSGNITFTPQQYASTELTAVQALLATMMAGNSGLPAAVEAALFSRERGRQDALAAKAVQEALEEFASRGFSLPPGALNAKVMETRQNSQNVASAASRDIYIQNQKEALESLRAAVVQGVALEGKLMDTFMHLQDLQLQAQKYMLDATVAIFNANVSLFNAKQQAYAIAAQVYRDRIQAELAKLEIYKAELEGQKLVSEINKDLVSIYEAQIRAVLALVEEYKAQLEGVRTQTEIDRNRIEVYRTRVSAYAEEVRAYAVQWDAYKAQVEGDATRAKIFDTQVNAYATQVRSIAEGNSNLIAQGTLQLEAQKTAMLGWRGRLDRLIADMTGERDRIQAGATVYEGKARVYSAAGTIAAAESDSNTRAFTAIVEAGRASKEIALENVKAHIQQIVQIATIIAEQLKAAAQTASQLAAGAMSAVHFGAQAADQNSTHSQVSCATDYQYSGTI